jgi:protein TonB
MLVVNKTKALEYLGYPHFVVMFAFAVSLHLLALFGWSMMPHLLIIDIPVQPMNIRLGNMDVQQIEAEDSPQPTYNNSAQLESAMAKMIRKPVEEKAIKKLPPKPRAVKAAPLPNKEPSLKQAQVVNDKSNSPRQFVRFNSAEKEVDKEDGSVLGNSKDSKAEIKSRYEQTISLWIQKFKLYPRNARAQGMEGSTVVRIRIDRRGNIRYSVLEGNTGYEELDRAALDMVRRANPVPAVPDSYPEGEMFEYLIPVNFGIK